MKPFCSYALTILAFASFASGQNSFPTLGTDPVAVAVADFNKDGNLDVVAVNEVTNNVSVLLGDGHGSLGTASLFPVGQSPNAVVVADFNGDGNLDLAVTDVSANQNSTNILLGNGQGSFAAGPVVPAGGSYIAVGDLNKDGLPDLVMADRNTQISVVLNNGVGGFNAPTHFAVVPKNSGTLFLGDFNGDGNLDVIVNDLSVGGGWLAFGDGTGNLSVSHSVPTPNVVADVNKDGKLDVVSMATYPFAAGVYLGKGDGTFTLVSPATGFAAADFNADGNLDLLTTATVGSTSEYEVALGDSKGDFGPPALWQPADCCVPPILAIGDLNKDGKADFVFISSGDTVTVAINPGNWPPFSRTTTTSLTSSPNPSGQGQAVTFTANVSPTSGTGTPSGTVVVGGLGSATLNSSGIATFTVSNLPLGPTSVVASYSGDSQFAPGNSYPPLLQQVNSPLLIASFTNLNSSPNPSVVGQNVILTAMVTGQGGTPSGTVTFQDGASNLGNASLAAGTATLFVSSLTAGQHTLTAVYGGDISFGPSTSPAVTQTVNNSGSAAFSVGPSPGSQTSETINAGQSATFDLTLTPAGSFAGTVNLSCTVTPAVTSAPTCHVPSSVNVTAGSAAPFTVSVTTSAAATAGAVATSNLRTGTMPLLAALFASALLCIPKPPRWSTLVQSAALLMVIGLAGCGGGSSSSSTTSGTPAGTYTIVVTGTSGSTTQSMSLTLKVN